MSCLAVYITFHYANVTPEPVYVAPAPATEQSILEAVNAERAKAGVAPLKLHSNISKSAKLKADDMLNRGYRSHYLPDKDDQPTDIFNTEMWSLIDPLCSESSENISYRDMGVKTPLTTKISMTGWLNSEPHRNAILNPKYDLTGVGISADNTIVVQHFCVSR